MKIIDSVSIILSKNARDFLNAADRFDDYLYLCLSKREVEAELENMQNRVLNDIPEDDWARPLLEEYFNKLDEELGKIEHFDEMDAEAFEKYYYTFTRDYITNKIIRRAIENLIAKDNSDGTSIKVCMEI